jgi:peptidyl-prolyl cis-trans isomerase D
MLSALRKHAYSWTIRVLLFAVVVVFAFWGLGTGLFSTVRPVATIDGKRVLASQVDQEALRLRNNLRATYGENAEQLIKTINLRQQALERIIEGQVVEAEARTIGIRISDAALQHAITSEKAFQVDGRFDFETYRAVLRANDWLPAEYELSIRNTLTDQMVRKMVAAAVQVSDNEARQEFDLNNQKIGLAYIEVPYLKFIPGIQPKADQIKKYYAANREQFREPDRVKIDYIYYDPAKLADKIVPSDKEIADVYQAGLKKLFTHPEQVRARHILVLVAPDASPQTKAAAQAKAERLLKQIQGGASFAQLARLNSDDPGSRAQGGEIGLFSRGQLVKPFEEIAFKLRPGQLGIARSEYGYHVIQVEERRAPHVETLAEARPKISEALRLKAGSKAAREVLGRDLSRALTGTDLKELAKERGLSEVETPWFAQTDSVPGPAAGDPNLLIQAFKLSPGEIRAVSGKQNYLVKLVARKPSFIPELKEVESDVQTAFVRDAAEAQANQLARKLLGEIKGPADLATVASKNGLKITEAPVFSRSDAAVPEIGSFPEVTDAAALLPTVPSLLNQVMQRGGNSYIFEVVSRSLSNGSEWKSGAAKFQKTLLEARREQEWQAFLDTLKSRARITVDAAQLGGEPSEEPM